MSGRSVSPTVAPTASQTATPTAAPAAAPAAALAVLLAFANPAAAFELGDLFRTPAQRAAARLAAGEHEALIERAPDARWEGFGRYAAGDHAGAAAAFGRALREREAGAGEGADGEPLPAAERDALLFERATAETRAGRPGEALPLYDAILERDPSHADARHNRDIARALLALDERERERPSAGQDGNGGEPDEGEPAGEPADAEGSGEPGENDAEPDDEGRQEDGDGSEDGDGRPGASARDEPSGGDAGRAGGDPSDPGQRPGGGSRGDEADAAERAAEAAAAGEALAAERRRAAAAGAADGATDDAEGSRVAGETRTPGEREQATEQWLRRIVDDPAGLLRRRLERSHRDDYPEVGDGDEPW